MIQLDIKYQRRLSTIYDKLQELSSMVNETGDLPLNYGNGTVCEQLSCALASLDTIWQEISED